MKKFYGIFVTLAVTLTILSATKNNNKIIFYDAMDVLVNKEVVRIDVRPNKKFWECVSRKNNPKFKWNWRCDYVLKSCPVSSDADYGQNCPILKFAIPIPEDGFYRLRVDGVRTCSYSLDSGKTWSLVEPLGFLSIPKMSKGTLSVWLSADKVAFSSNGPKYINGFWLSKAQMRWQHVKVNGFAKKRVEEKLDRGLAALEIDEGKRVYLTWRQLKNDPADIAFDVFECVSGRERKINLEPIKYTTDFVVETPSRGASYIVKPCSQFQGLIGESTVQKCHKDMPGVSWRTFYLEDSWDKIFHVGIGDLDGDGAYDYVVRHGVNVGSIDPWSVVWKPSVGPFKLTAFKSDGTRLWTKSLSWNIESGIWYAPFVVVDIDGDGKAEVVAKTSDMDIDYRETSGPDKGKVLKGPEYLSVFDGMSGKELARAPWPEREIFDVYNRSSRNQIAVAYLDGKTPYLLAVRGTYAEMVVDAWEYNFGKLNKVWRFDNREASGMFWGQGAHTTICMDIDEDGRDEVVLGSSIIDDDGTPLWSTGHGHPDRVLIAPVKGGEKLYYMEQCETKCFSGGVCCHDAKTGKMIWQLDQPTQHVHLGWYADADATRHGWLCTSTDLLAGRKSKNRVTRIFDPNGNIIEQGATTRYNCANWGYWDADLQREQLWCDVGDYRGDFIGIGFRGVFLAKADVLGDWREEIFATVPGELRIYSTLFPAYDKRVCLMQDKNYRATVYCTASGYLPETMLSYLPVDRAVGLSILRTAPNEVEVSVSSPQNEEVRGFVTVSIDDNGGVAIPNRWRVDIGKNKIVTQKIRINLANQEIGQIKAVLTNDDGRRREVFIPVMLNRKIGLSCEFTDLEKKSVLIDAEKFSRASNKKIKARGVGACVHHGRVLDLRGQGNFAEYKFKAPHDGAYKFFIRYGANNFADIDISIDNGNSTRVKLRPTGGTARQVYMWREVEIPEFDTIRLRHGEHLLRVAIPNNESGVALDCFALDLIK